ncbi:hypothetical protein PFISCL1PPCAC_9206, partial [Pristionchus fissidentatus]
KDKKKEIAELVEKLDAFNEENYKTQEEFANLHEFYEFEKARDDAELKKVNTEQAEEAQPSFDMMTNEDKRSLDYIECDRTKEMLEQLRIYRKYSDEEILAALEECRENRRKDTVVDNKLDFFIDRLLIRLKA